MPGHTRGTVATSQSAAGLRIVFAGGTGVARLTLADVSVFRVTGHSTCASVFTRRVLATIKHSFTAFARVSRTALAPKVVVELDAVVRSVRVTRIRQTFVDVTFTAFAHETGRTHTPVTTHAVHAAASVEAPQLTG